MHSYKGKRVTILRKANAGDEGYVSGLDQSLIKGLDGSQAVVLTTEIIEDKKTANE